MFSKSLSLAKLRLKLALITLQVRFSLMSRRTVPAGRVALWSAMIVLVGLAPITVSSTIMALTSKSLVIPSEGSVTVITSPDTSEPNVDVGVYWDSGCQYAVSSIQWETIDPGSSDDAVVYIRNEGDADVTLDLEATSWDPAAASDHMTLSWNYDGQSINPDEVIQATLTLSVSPSIDGITTFNFDIVITASG